MLANSERHVVSAVAPYTADSARRRGATEFRRLRALAPRALDNLDRSYDIELTYTSNAIEGNTLTAVETTLVIEQGITIAGKPL